MGKESKSSDEESKPTVAKSALELQRFKLEKLMKNPDKPVVIPERLREKKMPHVPEFVRNVMGSSAGAGSGEFHVYRHLRRKEYARQKFIQEKSEKQLLEEAYHQKLLDNKQAAEEKTAKKRAKRLKKKANKKLKRTNPKNTSTTNNEILKEESESEDESENEASQEQKRTEVNEDSENNSDGSEGSFKLAGLKSGPKPNKHNVSEGFNSISEKDISEIKDIRRSKSEPENPSSPTSTELAESENLKA